MTDHRLGSRPDQAAFAERAPRAFEVGLHLTSALTSGDFGRALNTPEVAGLYVAEAEVSELPAASAGALHCVAAGHLSLLASKTWADRLQCPVADRHDPDDGPIELIAFLDAVVGGEGWLVGCRLAWRGDSLTETACSRAQDRMLVVVDVPEEPLVQCHRLGGRRKLIDESAWRVVRDAVVREVVLRPAIVGPGRSRQ